jgi:hypothetical protein
VATPTPANPIILNEDGTISALVYQGRTFRLEATHEGLTSYSGYKARFGITDKYGNALLASASSEPGGGVGVGTITFAPAVDPDTGLPAIGTTLTVVIPDETTETIVAKIGKLDLVLEEPGGSEIPMVVGDWVLFKRVTP